MRSKPLFLALLAPLVLAACTTTGPQPGADRAGAGNPAAFWENLPAIACVRTDDGLRALAEFGQVDGADNLSHPDLVGALREKGWLEKGPAPVAPEAAFTRGQAAVVLCRIMGIRGGLSMRLSLLGSTDERYATREMVFLGILPAGSSPGQSLSGLELLRALGFAERHKEEHPD